MSVRWSLATTVSSLTITTGGVFAASVHFFAGTPGDPEGWFASVGFGAPFMGLGLLALVGAKRDRPELTFASAWLLIPMSVVSIVLIPLIVPAVVLIASAAREPLSAQDLAVSVIFAGSVALSFAYLVFHQDPAEWSTPEGGGGSSNIVTTVEAALAVGSAMITVALSATCRCSEIKTIGA